MPYAFTPHIPYYYQIKEDMKRDILSGSLRAGEQLTNEIDLARAYGVSRPTLRRAIQELVGEGFLHTVRGKGTFVRNPVLFDDAETFTVFPDMEQNGQMWEADALTQVPVPPAIVPELDLPRPARVWRIVLRHASHGRPVAVRTLYLPVPRFPDLKDRLRGRSTMSALAELGLKPTRAVQRFQALACDSADAPLLATPEGTPVMVWQGVLTGADGTRLAYVRTVFLGEAYVFLIHQERAGAAATGPVLVSDRTDS